MENISVQDSDFIGKKFIPDEFLPAGEDEDYLRSMQNPRPGVIWRKLEREEIERLELNNNTCGDWSRILVSDRLDTRRIRNCNFYGHVRIGRIGDTVLEHNGLQVPSGITDSTVVSCDIGDDTAVHGVHYLARYIIGDRCILFNIGEMITSDCARFGNGILKQGESEDSRDRLNIINETGSRSVLPFDGITPADAYIWAKYRDDARLQEKLKEMTQNNFDDRRGFYGSVGEQCIIKHTRIIRDLKAGSHCIIKGTNSLCNLTVNSGEPEPTEIGEGVELENGIVGYGCRILSGSKAAHFVLGNNCTLKYGARLTHTFLGDNSTISCCEVQNNLIFPAHEQHHNNSFLIASLLMGQSNLAAGATIGSNHNSRSNDGEVVAGRGFWPGLCTSIKHSCRFASFVLLSKGAYPEEMDIPLPLSLVSNNESKDRLEVMPAFWWMYNMYALARNAWKFSDRDKRKNGVQNIEFDWLAPDTVEEMIEARRLLEIWTAKASLRKKRISPDKKKEAELVRIGKKILAGSEKQAGSLEVLGEGTERSNRKTVILKTFRAYHAYGDMILHYAVKNLMDFLRSNPDHDFGKMCAVLKNKRTAEWINLGGQPVTEKDLDRLRADIASGALGTWEDVHKRYEILWNQYPQEKYEHAFACLCELLETDTPAAKQWADALKESVRIQEFIRDQVYITRKKDFENGFRQNTYRNEAEMTAAIGTPDGNAFIGKVRNETDAYIRMVDEIRKRA
jgi:hypothetical protein